MSSNNERDENDQARDRTTTNVTDEHPVRDGSAPLDEGRGRNGRRSAEREPSSGVHLSRVDWEELEPNPDPRADLGYRVDDWERFDTSDSSDQVIYLPSEESLIEEDAFIVAEEAVLCDLGEYY